MQKKQWYYAEDSSQLPSCFLPSSVSVPFLFLFIKKISFLALLTDRFLTIFPLFQLTLNAYSFCFVYFSLLWVDKSSPLQTAFDFWNSAFVFALYIARDNLVFLQKWLLKFPQYKNRDLFITGESYAGKYFSLLNPITRSKLIKQRWEWILNLL